jgi:hypothetical protein
MVNYLHASLFYVFKVSLLFGFVILYDLVQPEGIHLINLSSLAFVEKPNPYIEPRKRGLRKTRL